MDKTICVGFVIFIVVESLHTKIIAEGIESSNDLETLKELGVSYIWTMVILGRRREITRNIAKKIETLLKKYNCEPLKEPK